MAINTNTLAETTPLNENVREDLLHRVHSLAPIYDVNEFNLKTGHRLTQDEYIATIQFLNVDTKEQTLEKYRRMADKTFEKLVKAKQVYCESKDLYGLIPGISR
jgi:hypothetical protein